MPAPDNLAIPLHYCREKTGGTGSALYYSLLFQAPATRMALTALYALQHELDDIADECTDTGVARTKLGWWHDELDRAFADQARHPVTLLLTPALREHQLPRAWFDELLQTALVRLPPLRYTRLDDVQAHTQYSGGAIAALAALILHGDPVTARTLGAALERAEWLCDLGHYARADRLPVALEELARFNVATADILRGKDNEAFHSFMASETTRAEAAVRDALQALDPAGRRALLPLRIQAYIVLARLTTARRRGYAVLRQRPTLTPLRLLWIAWRTRHGA